MTVFRAGNLKGIFLNLNVRKEDSNIVFIGLDNKVKTGLIPWTKLKGFPRNDEAILVGKNELLPAILKITSKRGHTQNKNVPKYEDDAIIKALKNNKL